MFLTSVFTKKECKNKYKVAVCAIFKDEGIYLREWLEYHLLAGVNHFYLYNNFSTDNYKEILASYIDDGIVTLTEFPVKQGQILAYKDCIEKYRNETEWLGFIDIDEFIVPLVHDTIYDFLKNFKKFPSVMLSWKTFGTAGKIDRDNNNLVTEDFIICQPDYYMGKSFYNTKYSYNPNSKYNGISMHHFFYGSILGIDIPPVNANKKFYFTTNKEKLDKSVNLPIQLNHYYCKSFNEYSMKVNRGDVLHKMSNYGLERLIDIDKKCTCTDVTAYKYLFRLKNQLKNK